MLFFFILREKMEIKLRGGRGRTEIVNSSRKWVGKKK